MKDSPRHDDDLTDTGSADMLEVAAPIAFQCAKAKFAERYGSAGLDIRVPIEAIERRRGDVIVEREHVVCANRPKTPNTRAITAVGESCPDPAAAALGYRKWR